MTGPATWSTACPDWQERILGGRSLVPELPLDRDEAERALRTFKRLRLPDVPGKPSFGEAGRDWFFDILAALFGSLIDGTRHIQEVFLMVPKKNSKSTNSAGLIVTAIILNRRPAAEYTLLAPTKEIADISYGQADGMIKADPALAKIFHTQRHIRRITDRRCDAFIKVKAADTDAITGGKPTGTLIDETHEFARKPRAADVFIEARGALAARPDGFLVQITTQSKTPPAGVFKAELARARAVRDGRMQLPLLPVLYELPPQCDWRDPAHFGLVNPNLGCSVNAAFLEREMTAAEIEGRDKLALFASQHLNVEIGLALRSDRWAGADHWEGRGDPRLTFAAILERSDVVTIGIDGGGLDDLLGLAVLGRDAKTRQWLLWCRAWVQASVLTLRKSEAARLRDLERSGDLRVLEMPGDDIVELAGLCAETAATGKLAKIGLDPMGIGAIVDALAEKNIAGDQWLVGIPQGWKMTGAIKTAERKLAEGSLAHAGQALMAWAVGNAKVEPRGNAIVITKQASGTAKIDPLMAALDAIAVMSTNPQPNPAPGEGRSIYSTMSPECYGALAEELGLEPDEEGTARYPEGLQGTIGQDREDEDW